MAQKILMLALSPTMESGTIAKWRKQEGDKVKSGDVICEVETDKTTMDYETDESGTLLKIIAPEGKQASIGETIAVIGDENEDIAEMLASLGSESVSAPHSLINDEKPQKIETDIKDIKREKIFISPLAKRIAQEKSIDLQFVTGTGPNGRITKKDVEDFIATRKNAEKDLISSSDEVIKISQKRKIIAQRLAESKFTAPHYYLKLSINMGEILKARQAINEKLKEKLSLNAFIIKLTAEALKKHKIINSTWTNDSIIIHKSVDIGIAVAQEEGLITPIVKDCGNLGIAEIDKKLKELIEKARNNKLQPDEYNGATFTISNLGSYGIEEFTAIINPPGSAILAIGKVQKTPIVNEREELEIQQTMKATLSCDHRIIDGATGALFMKDLKDIFESPITALI